MAFLRLENIRVDYDGKTALQDVSVSIPRHRITAVIGPSGCGKTTLLHCMNGMISETKCAKIYGNVWLNEQKIDLLPKEEIRRRIGLVFQTPAPFPFSIYKNMTYAPQYYGIKNKKKLDEIVKDKLKMAGLYDEVKDELQKNAYKLSGGQQQRLCIARALTVEPEILLLDEPCSALDVQSSGIIEKLLTGLKNTYTIIMVTHNIQQARRISDYVIFLHGGHLVEAGETAQIFENPRKQETINFLRGVFG